MLIRGMLWFGGGEEQREAAGKGNWSIFAGKDRGKGGVLQSARE